MINGIFVVIGLVEKFMGVCRFCKNEYWTTNLNRICCSRDCLNRLREKRNKQILVAVNKRRGVKVVWKKRFCPICGKVFSRRTWWTCCSRRCKSFNDWRNSAYSQIIRRCKRKGLAFDLKKEDLMVPKGFVCPILGIRLKVGGKHYDAPSVDRVDLTKGYIKGNVFVMSMAANAMKMDMPISAWKKLRRKIEGL